MPVSVLATSEILPESAAQYQRFVSTFTGHCGGRPKRGIAVREQVWLTDSKDGSPGDGVSS